MATRARVPAGLAILETLLTGLGPGGPSAEDRETFVRLLRDSSALVVARTAHAMRELELREMLPELEEAAERCLTRTARQDPGCIAKLALFRTLYDLECARAALYRDALAVRQYEPVWGGRVDAAAGLRAIAGQGLTLCDDAGRVDLLAELLADPEPEARAGALQALGACGDPAALPLLRYLCLCESTDTDTRRAAMVAILALGGDDEIAFVARSLDQERPALLQAAALALCESGLEAALAPVIQLLEGDLDQDPRELLCLALAGSGLAPGRDWLLQRLMHGRRGEALDALHALHALRDDHGLCVQVADAIAVRAETALELEWRLLFRDAEDE